MKLWRLTDPNPDYDEIHQVVVRAESEDAARLLVAKEGPNSASRFMRPNLVSCERITIDGPAEIICTDVIEG